MNLPELILSFSVLDDSKQLDPTNLVLLVEREYTVEVSLKLKKMVPQRVFAPRFKKPKNYSYFVFVENSSGQILAWKRASVVKNTTIKLDLCLKNVGSQELTIRVMCDSVVGIDESVALNVKVTGSEEEAEQVKTDTQNFEVYTDEEMDAEQFEDDLYDEYLADGF